MSCGIYKITNLINNKIYIGQSVNIEVRFTQHKNFEYNLRQHPSSHLYKAMKKYGIENFSFEIIEKCKVIELDDKEIYWIKFYDSRYNGYNETDGGGGAKAPVVQYDKDGNFIKIFDSVTQAEFLLGKLKQMNIAKACAGICYESGGFQWRYHKDVKDNYMKNIGKSPLKEKYAEGGSYSGHLKLGTGKSVAQCDKDTHEIIKLFNTIKEASEETGICFTSIYKVCKGTRKTAGGYYWLDIDKNK